MTPTIESAIAGSIGDDDLLKHGRKMFVDWIGGAEVIDMMVLHGQNISWRQIGAKHGVDHKTAASWVRAARRKMRSVGLTPPGEHEGLSPRQPGGTPTPQVLPGAGDGGG